MTTSIAELLPRARALKYEIHASLNAVEAGHADASDCEMQLGELQRQLRTLTSLLNKERPDKRSLWKLKLDELRNETDFLAADLRRFRENRATALQREQLFHRRSVASTTAIDNLTEEGESLVQSQNKVDQLIETGLFGIKSLEEQRERLKNAQRNIFSMINTLGISTSVMSMIQSRQKNDRYIVFGGMALCLVALYVCVRWL